MSLKNMKAFNLEKEPKMETGFKTPENYFESFEAKMLTQLPKEEPKIIKFSTKKMYIISSIAAAILAFIAIPKYFNLNSSSETYNMETYLSYTVSQEDIIDKLTIEDIQSLEKSLTLSHDGLEEYLSETQNLDFYLNYLHYW